MWKVWAKMTITIRKALEAAIFNIITCSISAKKDLMRCPHVTLTRKIMKNWNKWLKWFNWCHKVVVLELYAGSFRNTDTAQFEKINNSIFYLKIIDFKLTTLATLITLKS